MSREHILSKVRTALGRSCHEPPEGLGPARLCIPEVDLASRLSMFRRALEELGGQVWEVESGAGARSRLQDLLGGRMAVASRAPLLKELGVLELGFVTAQPESEAELRKLCSEASVGITGADYALADTGSLVTFSSSEARMLSLLPPVHVAVIRKEQILTGLDELFTLVPLPADRASSMVIITGPSRTADIEQILVRGVHGPGEIHVIVV